MGHSFIQGGLVTSYAAVSQRELCSPSGQTLDTYSTLGEKIEGQNSTHIHQGLNITSPGTHFFLRFEGSELTTFFPVVKERPVFDTSLTGYK
jgi:hypothetical protein